ncbi:MAG TPA: hypothetical protein VNU26_06045, partial [Mycobacteriales bacterium]|nr:hypothetical protein [Mycobacteriales bacterium]
MSTRTGIGVSARIRRLLPADPRLAARRGIAVVTATALFATMGAAGTSALAAPPAPTDAAPPPAAADGSAADGVEGPVLGPPQWGELIAPGLTPEQARARLDELLAAAEELRRAAERRAAQQQARLLEAEHRLTQQRAAQTRGQTVSLTPGGAPQKTPQQLRQEEAARRVAEAEARIQEALQALARALSTGACTTTGGTNGTAATISCPVAGGEGSVTTSGPGQTTAPASGGGSADGAGPGAGTESTHDDLTASAAPAVPAGTALHPADAGAALDAVRAEWAAVAVGVDLSGLTVAVEDLPGLQLGESRDSLLVVDLDAAGWGWGPAGMDLATVLRHEVGHSLGLGHTATGLMADTLEPGVVRTVDTAPALPGAGDQGGDQAATGSQPVTSGVSGGSTDGSAPAGTEPGTAGTTAVTEDGASPADPATTTTTSTITTTTSGDEAATGAAAAVFTVIAGTAVLTSTDGDPLDGTLSVDPVRGELVFTAPDGAEVRQPLAGVDAVTVEGGDGVTADLTGAPADLTVSVRTADGSTVALAPGTITITGITADLLLTADGQALVLRGLTALAALRFAAPALSAVLDAGTGRLTVTGELALLGADLTLAGRQVTVSPGSVLDLTGAAGTGNLTIAATDSGSTVSAASLEVTGAVLRAGDVRLTASSSADAGTVTGARAVAVASSSATVTVLDATIEALGAVLIAADSSAAGRAVSSATGGGSAGTDAAAASVVLDSTAVARLGGTSAVTAGGDLVVLAGNSLAGSAVADAAAATAGGAVATAAGNRFTRAVVDTAGTISAGSVSVLADSSGSLTSTSTGSTAGAMSNAVAPISLTGGVARTLAGPVPAAAALGLARTAGLTEALLGPGLSRALQVVADRSALVRAVTAGTTGAVADSSGSTAGAAVAVALSTLTTRAAMAGGIALQTPALDVEALLPDAATTAAATTGGSSVRDAGLAVAVGRLDTLATGLPGSRLAAAGTDVAVRSTSSATTSADAGSTGTAPSLAVVVVDDRTGSSLGDGVVLLGARGLTVRATSADTADSLATAGSAVTLSTVLTSAGLGSGPALLLTGALLVRADQTARATSRGDGVAVTAARHDAAATTGRPVDAAAVTVASNGTSVVRADAGTGWASLLGALAAARSAADGVAGAFGVRLPALPSVDVATAEAFRGVAIASVVASASATLPAGLPVRSDGPVELPASSNVSAGAGAGGGAGSGDLGGRSLS